MLPNKNSEFTKDDEDAFVRIDSIKRQDVSFQDAMTYMNLIDKAKASGSFDTLTCFKSDLTDRYTNRYLYFKKRYSNEMNNPVVVKPLDDDAINRLKGMAREEFNTWLGNAIYDDSLPQGWLAQVILEVPRKPLMLSYKALFVKTILIGKYGLVRKAVVRSKILKIDFNLANIGDLYIMYKNFMNEFCPNIEHKTQPAFKKWIKAWCCLDGDHKSYSSQRHKLANPVTGVIQELEYFHLKDRDDLKNTWIKLSKTLEYTQEEEDCYVCRMCFGDWKDQKGNRAVCDCCLDKYLGVNKKIKREELIKLNRG